MNAAPKVTVLPISNETPIDSLRLEPDKTPIRILPRSGDVQTTGKMRAYRIDLTSYTTSEPRESQKVDNLNNEREIVRQRLLEAGFLVTSILTPEDGENRILSPEEIAIVGKLPPNAKTIQEILDEDRGEY
jgi:hypothetical protein